LGWGRCIEAHRGEFVEGLYAEGVGLNGREDIRKTMNDAKEEKGSPYDFFE
jgi:hypothetical protein